jgi:hypothetical protein
MEYVEIQGWNAFEEQFRPIKNKFTIYGDDVMFETYGDELDFVKSQNNNNVWTYVQGDLSMLLVNGYSIVNRLGYYITEVPWEDDKDYTVVLSEDVECECYDEEGHEDNGGEYGKADCTKCEGYGYVTNYV